MKTPRDAVAADDRPYAKAQRLQAQLGSVEVSFVTRECHALVSDEHGSSIGAQVDTILCEAVRNGRVANAVTVHLFDNQLEAVHDYYSA